MEELTENMGQKKRTRRYLLADVCVEINSIHEYIHDYCADYTCNECKRFECCGYIVDGCSQEPEKSQNNQTDGFDRSDTSNKFDPNGYLGRHQPEFQSTQAVCPPDISVSISQADIEFERKKSILEDQAAGRSIRQFYDPYLETLAVYRQIAEKMPAFDTFLIHGSSVAVDGVAYLFIAKSGTGKSTHTRLWRELLGSRAVMINDDKPLVRLVNLESPNILEASEISETSGASTDSIPMIYGTPWSGKHNLNTNTAAPLRAICILERGKENSIEKLSKKEAFSSLVRQIYRPANSEAMLKTLVLIDRLNVDYYRLACNMDIEVARLSYGVMSGQGQWDFPTVDKKKP